MAARKRKPVTPSTKAKQDAVTEAAIAAFLARGGKVTKVSPVDAAENDKRKRNAAREQNQARQRVGPRWTNG